MEPSAQNNPTSVGARKMLTTTSLPTKIVVAIDGSAPSLNALSYALKLASVSKASILLLHVLLLPSETESETLEALRKDMTAKSMDLLSKAVSMAKSNNVSIEKRTVETSRSVSMAIVDLSAKEKADLIVLGTQGVSGYGKMMLGSTAAGVVSFANCPVLAVR